MSWKSRFALLAGTACVAHFVVAAPPKAAPKIEQKVTGPVANYWMSAATNTGSGFGAMGMGGQGGGRPSMGDMMRMMRGGSAQVQHNLTLQLGSSQAPTGDPKADHVPGAYQALPLVTPKEVAAAPMQEETVEQQPTMPQRPRGRMLIYWGCGEHAGPGQPLVIDFSKLGAGQPMPHFPFIPVHHQNPPSAGRYKTYGEWPNGRTQEQPPALLAGAHSVHGNYSPDIKFTLPPNRDYMPPLMIDASTKTPAGATLLAWQPVAGATGYFAAMFGASPGKDGGDPTIVMWSSSGQQTFAGGGLLDYLAPAEVRRLIGDKAVMPPDQTKCAIPAEVTSSAPMGMLSMIAYGEEADFADPPRPVDPHVPWNISWTVKVRYKSTAGLMVGMPAMHGGMGAMPAAEQSGDPNAPPAQADQPKKKKGGWMSKLKDAAEAAGAIPH